MKFDTRQTNISKTSEELGARVITMYDDKLCMLVDKAYPNLEKTAQECIVLVYYT